jgi:hypothetical protein
VGDKVWVPKYDWQSKEYEKKTIAHTNGDRVFIRNFTGIEEIGNDFMFHKGSIIQYQIFNLMTQSPLFGVLLRFVAHSLLMTGFIFTLYALALVISPITK